MAKRRNCKNCPKIEDCAEIECRIRTRLKEELESWRGTPWRAGQCCKGVACDCRGFLIGVMDNLYGIEEPRPKRMAQDLSQHAPQLAMAVVLEIVKRYPVESFEPPVDELAPGDIVLKKGGDGWGPSHVLIVGPYAKSLWHSHKRDSMVIESGMSELFNVVRVWRPAKKELWLETVTNG